MLETLKCFGVIWVSLVAYPTKGGRFKEDIVIRRSSYLDILPSRGEGMDSEPLNQKNYHAFVI